MPAIFISYRRSDSQDVTGRIYDRLVAKFTQKQVFKDVDNIPLGVSFRMHLQQMIGKSDLVLVIIGPTWLSATDEHGNRRLDDPADFVRMEVEDSLRANIPVIPVLVSNTPMPKASDLPRSIQKLIGRNGMAVRPDPDFNNDMNRLFSGIGHLEKLLKPAPPIPDKDKVESIVVAPPVAPVIPSKSLDPIVLVPIATPPPRHDVGSRRKRTAGPMVWVAACLVAVATILVVGLGIMVVATSGSRKGITNVAKKQDDGVGEREPVPNPKPPLPKPAPSNPIAPVKGDSAPATTTAFDKIMDEIRLIPLGTPGGDINQLKAPSPSAGNVKEIDAYKNDGYANVVDLRKQFQVDRDAFTKKFPLRAGYFEAIETLEEINALKVRDKFGKAEANSKKLAILREQEPLGVAIFKLETVQTTMKKAAGNRDTETSKRWRANFDYAHARLLSRLVYLYEASFAFGQIRSDNLPALTDAQSGWRLSDSRGLHLLDARKYAKEAQMLWKRIQDENPGTPWAVLALQESTLNRGLEWRPATD